MINRHLQKSLILIKENVKKIVTNNIFLNSLRKEYFQRMYCHYYNEFINKLNLKIKELQLVHKQFYVSNCYVIFLKNLCELVGRKCKSKKKISDADELYLCNLKNKTFTKLKQFTTMSLNVKGVQLRKNLITRIFFMNLLALHVIILSY